MSRPTLALLPLLFVLGCVTAPETDVVTGHVSPCEGVASVELAVPPGVLGEQVPLDLTLIHPDAPVADVVELYFARPDTAYQPMSVLGSVTGLPSSAEGSTHTVVWDARADLGEGVHPEIRLRAVVRSPDCNPWPPADRTVEVSNGDPTTERCTITSLVEEQPVEGLVRLGFELAHPSAATASVTLSWEVDGSTGRATLAAEDCDDDGAVDQASDLALTPEGVAHCLTWDSEQDLNLDARVSLTLGCAVGAADPVLAELGPVELRNDLAPDPGELVFTEIMAQPLATDGYYLELRSVAKHALDLAGLTVARWRAVTPRTSPADRTFVVEPPTGALVVHPGELVLLAASDDPVRSGCRRPDLVWPAAFSLRSDSVIVLQRNGLSIAEQDFTDAAGWRFSEGVAWGVDPTLATTAEHGARESWCPQSSETAACVELPQTDEVGTPGLENDRCPGI